MQTTTPEAKFWHRCSRTVGKHKVEHQCCHNDSTNYEEIVSCHNFDTTTRNLLQVIKELAGKQAIPDDWYKDQVLHILGIVEGSALKDQRSGCVHDLSDL